MRTRRLCAPNIGIVRESAWDNEPERAKQRRSRKGVDTALSQRAALAKPFLTLRGSIESSLKTLNSLNNGKE